MCWERGCSAMANTTRSSERWSSARGRLSTRKRICGEHRARARTGSRLCISRFFQACRGQRAHDIGAPTLRRIQLRARGGGWRRWPRPDEPWPDDFCKRARWAERHWHQTSGPQRNAAVAAQRWRWGGHVARYLHSSSTRWVCEATDFKDAWWRHTPSRRSTSPQESLDGTA